MTTTDRDGLASPQSVLDFWLGELELKDWYAVNPRVDATIRERFAPSWQALHDGRFLRWLTGCTGALAYIILADQFPRNMFRGEARAFATDSLALAAARTALAEGWDETAPEPDRQFFYMPFMHSEDMEDQDRSLSLFRDKMPDTGASNLVHAEAHAAVIRRFGRFSYRNVALGRETTPEEQAFLDDGGYASAMRDLKSD